MSISKKDRAALEKLPKSDKAGRAKILAKYSLKQILSTRKKTIVWKNPKAKRRARVGSYRDKYAKAEQMHRASKALASDRTVKTRIRAKMARLARAENAKLSGMVAVRRNPTKKEKRAKREFFSWTGSNYSEIAAYDKGRRAGTNAKNPYSPGIRHNAWNEGHYDRITRGVLSRAKRNPSFINYDSRAANKKYLVEALVRTAGTNRFSYGFWTGSSFAKSRGSAEKFASHSTALAAAKRILPSLPSKILSLRAVPA